MFIRCFRVVNWATIQKEDRFSPRKAAKIKKGEHIFAFLKDKPGAKIGILRQAPPTQRLNSLTPQRAIP
ncbi:MAG: hypothetical protein IPN74_10445 [Haliscomenobacter sp.]|nr:hypothetical protein [Haliscomenobacter sp.]